MKMGRLPIPRIANASVLLIILGATAMPLAAQCTSRKDRHAGHARSAAEGDPASGSAHQLTPGLARIVVRDLLGKRFLPSKPDKPAPLGLGRPFPGSTFFESKAISVTRDALSFEYDVAALNKRTTHHPHLVLKDLDYVTCHPETFGTDSFFVVWDTQGIKEAHRELGSPYALAWKEAGDAQRFADALNRLIKEASTAGSGADDLVGFAAAAKSWQAKPESRPKPPEGWERHRILAEASVREKDVMGALGHYEDGLEVYPLWPEGWFNAALLYEALGEFEYAGNRMRHYLELAPDARDADAAREKLIIWDDKAHRQKESQ